MRFRQRKWKNFENSGNFSDILNMRKSVFRLVREFSFFFIISLILAAFFSCVTPRVEKDGCPRELLGNGIKNPVQLTAFFMSHKPDFADEEKVRRLAEYYVREAAVEGINSDAAFVQMCLETGFLGFGNLVLPEMNNFCGLGAMDEEHPGEYFESEEIGVRAHIQHLQAYATTEEVELHQELVDPRYSWVHKVKLARTVHDLAKNWATDPEYGEKLDGLLSELENY